MPIDGIRSTSATPAWPDLVVDLGPASTADIDGQSVGSADSPTGLESGDVNATEDPAIAQACKNAEANLVAAIEPILFPDALALARGARAPLSVEELTEEQQETIRAAVGEYFLELPLGGYNRKFARLLRDVVTEVGGADPGDLAAIPVRALPGTIDGLETEHPDLYRALQFAGFIAKAAYGYREGSEGLKQIGIEPEISISRFGFRTAIELGWNEGFEDFAPRSLSIEKKLRAGDARHEFDVKIDFGDSQQRDVTRVATGYSLQTDTMTLAPGFEYDLETRDARARFGVSLRQNRNTTTSAVVTFDDRGAGISGFVSYHVRDSFDCVLYGEHNPTSGQRVGVGVKRRF